MDRRAMLQTLSATGALSSLPGAAFSGPQPQPLMQAMTPVLTPAVTQPAIQETLQPEPQGQPKYSIRFGVCGMSHDHIHGMIKAIQRGGGELVAAWGAEADKPGVTTLATRSPDRR